MGTTLRCLALLAALCYALSAPTAVPPAGSSDNQVKDAAVTPAAKPAAPAGKPKSPFAGAQKAMQKNKPKVPRPNVAQMSKEERDAHFKKLREEKEAKMTPEQKAEKEKVSKMSPQERREYFASKRGKAGVKATPPPFGGKGAADPKGKPNMFPDKLDPFGVLNGKGAKGAKGAVKMTVEERKKMQLAEREKINSMTQEERREYFKNRQPNKPPLPDLSKEPEVQLSEDELAKMKAERERVKTMSPKERSAHFKAERERVAQMSPEERKLHFKKMHAEKMASLPPEQRNKMQDRLAGKRPKDPFESKFGGKGFGGKGRGGKGFPPKPPPAFDANGARKKWEQLAGKNRKMMEKGNPAFAKWVGGNKPAEKQAVVSEKAEADEGALGTEKASIV